MRVIVVVHPTKLSRGWAYDVYAFLSPEERQMIKEAEDIIARINRRVPLAKLEVGGDGCCYTIPDELEPIRDELVCIEADDTLRIENTLRAMGLKNENDLEGLISFIQQVYKPDELYVLQ